MKKIISKTSLLFTIIALFLCYSSNVFAYDNNSMPQSILSIFMPQGVQSGRIEIIGDCLTMTSSTTATFKYKVLDPSGADVTDDKVIYYNTALHVEIFRNGEFECMHDVDAKIDAKTKTCTVTDEFDSYNAAEICMYVTNVYCNGYMMNCGVDKNLRIVNPYSKALDKINILSDSLTDAGKNIATFSYGEFNEAGIDITKDLPASNIEAFSAVYSTTFSAIAVDETTSSAITISSAVTTDSVTPSAEKKDVTTSSAIITSSSAITSYSAITLDPAQEKGTIKFDTSVNDKVVVTTLVDKSTGKNITLNTVGLGGGKSHKLVATEVYRIDFTSDKLIKTAADTAKIKYKISDHHFSDITSKITQDDIDAYAIIGKSKVKVNLDPVNGEGTLKYKFSDTDKDALVTITYKTGVTICEKLNIVNSESDNTEDKSNKDLGIAKIVFVPTGPEIYYHILNKYGRDITRDIPVSQLMVCSSVNCNISLSDQIKMGTLRECIINYNNYDNNRTIILTLMDRVSGVKASLNIGDQPIKEVSEDKTKDSKTDNRAEK